MNKKQYWADLWELGKPGIVMLALLMATLGFLLGSYGHVSLVKLFWTLLGTAMVGGASGTLNQYMERDIDALMWRTMDRPLPTGRLSPKTALFYGGGLALFGEAILFVAVNPITALLGLLTILSYVAVYTPAKRWSSIATLIGAVPGALPPLMGWTAAYGAIAPEGLILFAILFLWQIPHFLAIAWMYREDYGRAGLPILSVIDEKGTTTSKQIILYAAALLPISLIPSFLGMTGIAYLVGALVLGLGFLAASIWLAVLRTKVCARRLFFASILYLPALGFLMVWDRVL